MSIPLYIQTDAQIENSRVKSSTARAPEQLPALIEGTERDFSLYFITNSGAVDFTSGTPEVRLGVLGSDPWVIVTSFTTTTNGWTFSLAATPCTLAFSSTSATLGGGVLQIAVTPSVGNTKRVYAQLPVEIRRAISS